MSIAHKLTELLNGTLLVFSKEGEGSRFVCEMNLLYRSRVVDAAQSEKKKLINTC